MKTLIQGIPTKAPGLSDQFWDLPSGRTFGGGIPRKPLGLRRPRQKMKNVNKKPKKQHVAKKWNTTHAMRHRTESMESTVGRKRYANIER